jgi:hypothetical protein
LQVTLTAGASSVTISDGGAGDSDGSANSIINVNSVVGGYTFLLTLVTTNSPGGPLLSFVNSSTASITGAVPATVSVYASANGFTSPVTPPALVAMSGATAQFLSQTPNGNTATVSFSSYVDPSNAMTTAPTGTQIGTGSAGITQPGNNNTALSDTSILGSLAGPYALNLLLTATLNQGGSAIDLDGQVALSSVPEPAAIFVWSLFSTLGVVVAYRKMRVRQA